MTVASRSLLVVVAAALVLAPHALADQRAEADEAFKRAREAFKAGRYQEACDAFEESQALDPQLGTKFNLAQCYEQIGKLATARTMYTELRDEDTNEIRKKLTMEALAALEPRVPRIKVVVASTPPNLVVTARDAKGRGRPIEANADALVDAGAYKLIATADGMRDFTSEVEAREGQTTQVVVTFTPGAKHSGEEYSIWHPRSRKRLRAAAIIAGGGTLVLASFVIGYYAYDYHRQAEDLCPDAMCLSQTDLDRAKSLRDKGQLRGTISTVLFTGGVIAAGAGTVMYLLAKHEGPIVTPQVTTESAGVSVSGRF